MPSFFVPMFLIMPFRKDIERLCEISGTSVTFPSRVGYKTFNRLTPHRLAAAHRAGTVTDVPGERLRLGFDSLNDAFTLLDRPLASSPHYRLMEALVDARDLRATEYVRRLTDGTLTGDLPVTFDERHVRERFQVRDREIREGIPQWVWTITIGDSLYLVDGKHRAALSLLRGRPVHCVDMTPIIFDSSWRYRHYVLPSRHPDRFRTHLDLLGPVYERVAAETGIEPRAVGDPTK